MNISSIPPQLSSVSLIQRSTPVEKVHHFPENIRQQIATLDLITQKVLGHSSPSFCNIISQLNQPRSTISYEKCEQLFITAFIEEFKASEIHTFLTNFFNEFDPNKTFINFEEASEKGELFLWEHVIRYYCTQYIQFQASCLNLEEIFQEYQIRFDPDRQVILRSPLGLESELEELFHQSIDIIPQFSSDEVLQTKLMLINYAATLIETLKTSELDPDVSINLASGLTLSELFEEIYSLLLEFPFTELAETPLLHDYHNLLDKLDPQSAKEAFLEKLAQEVLDTQDPDYETKAQDLYAVMSKCQFLDFKIKSYLQHLVFSDPKKM